MSTLQLVAVVGLVAWAVVKAPAIRHLVLGIRNAIAFGTKPRELFERLRKQGIPAVPFAPVLGKRTHLLVDQTSITKLYALQSTVRQPLFLAPLTVQIVAYSEGHYQQVCLVPLSRSLTVAQDYVSRARPLFR